LYNSHFFWTARLLSIEFITEGKTVNKEKYIDIRHCLRDVVGRKCPEKWRTNICYLSYDKDPVQLSVLVNDFLTKNNVSTLEHPPYPPDLAPADFYLFPWLKSALKGQCFCDSTGAFRMWWRSYKGFHRM